MTALISFLGGSAFRLIFGGVLDYFNKKQEHSQEVELLRLQDQIDAQKQVRDLERLRLAAELKVEEVRVESEAALDQAAATAFQEAVRATGTKSGVAWVDAWNQSIRPAGATLSLAVWVAVMLAAGLVLTEFDKELIAAFLGVFVGERIHSRLK